MNMKLTSIVLALALLAACAPTTPEEPRACCMAMTASCLACAEGVTEEQYCATNPDAIGCELDEEVPSCAAIQCPVGNDCVDGVGCVPQEPQAKAPGTACTMEYNPVCGENGITYGNPCMAEAAGMNYTAGECA